MSNYINNKSIITMRVWLFILCSLILCLSGCSSKSKSSDTFVPEIEPIFYPYQLEESPDSFKVFVEVSSKENYFFNMYDMEIKIDGYEIGTVSNGKLFTKMLYLPEGYHEISLCKVGKNKPNTSDYFKVDEDMTYECSVAHRKAKIEFKGVQTKDDVEELNRDFYFLFVRVTSCGPIFARVTPKIAP